MNNENYVDIPDNDLDEKDKIRKEWENLIKKDKEWIQKQRNELKEKYSK